MAREKITTPPVPLPENAMDRMQDLIGIAPGERRGPRERSFRDELRDLRTLVEQLTAQTESALTAIAEFDEKFLNIRNRVDALEAGRIYDESEGEPTP